MKPIAIYARVSSERQREQETIGSQTAALLEHATNQNWVVPNEWRFVDEGYSGASLVPGTGSVARSGCRGTHRHHPDLLTGPAQPEVRISGIAERRVPTPWGRVAVCEIAAIQHPGRAAAGTGARDDRRIRTRPNRREKPARQAPSCASGLDQCAFWSSVRIPVREENGGAGGLLRNSR